MKTLAFLRKLQPEGPWALGAFEPDGGRDWFLWRKGFEREAHVARFLEEHKGWNLYYRVGIVKSDADPATATEDDIAAVVAIHADIDPPAGTLAKVQGWQKAKRAELKAWKDKGLPRPSVILSTGTGYQLLWLLVEPTTDKARAKACNRAVADRLGGDSTYAVNHLLRLPGTTNYPNKRKREKYGRIEPAAVEVVEFEVERRYTLDDFPADASREVETDEEAPHVEPGERIDKERLEALLPDAKLRQKIVSGEAADWSAWSFGIVKQLLKCGVDEKDIAALLTDPAYNLSRHYLNPKVETTRAVNRVIHSAGKSLREEEELGLVLTKDGIPKNTGVNIERLILHTFGQDLRFNVLAKKVEITAGPFKGFPENDLPVKLSNWLASDWQLYTSPGPVGEQLLYVARTFGSYDPVGEYLNGLEWDGTERLDTWLVDYCNAETVLDGKRIVRYLSKVGARFLISAVARALDPGCKVDTMLVLTGPQGYGKSQAVSILGGEWATATALDLGTKDSMMLAAAKWIVEFPELAAMSRGQVERYKAFLAQQQDDFRPPYGRVIESFARRTVFFGTTNQEEFLLDDTGNRRYWCVRIERPIDLDALRKDRDQLWAEAVVRYREGEPWWFDADEQGLADRVVQASRVQSPYVELINEWWARQLNKSRFFKLHEVADEACAIRRESVETKKKTLTAALKEAGFVPIKRRLTKGAPQVRGWVLHDHPWTQEKKAR